LLLTVATAGADEEYETSDEVPVVDPSDIVTVAPIASVSSVKRVADSALNARFFGVGGGVDSLHANATATAAVEIRRYDKARIDIRSRWRTKHSRRVDDEPGAQR
jgi:NH3-dependent NAD+ synthetase